MAAAEKVQVVKKGEGFELSVGGKPFVINGVGGQQHLEMLSKFGGNTIRTWGIDALAKPVDGKPLIDRAEELGLKVVPGIWLEHERHGFDYSKKSDIDRQREKVRQAVLQYKDRPGVLVWGLGNEMEGPMSEGRDERIWKEVNYLAGLVKQLDPNHPVMTVIAGAATPKIEAMAKNCPNVDILGVNAYSGAAGIGPAAVRGGWKKPFVLTEYGPAGHWEVRKTAWGAPIEATSTEKASGYFSTQSLLMENSKGACLGSIAFLWGHKQEVTSTWYGMLLPDGSKLGAVDALCYSWTGKWPEVRSPLIKEITAEFAEKEVAAGGQGTASVVAKSPSKRPLQYEWLVVSETKAASVGGDHEDAPPSHPECVVSQTAEGSVTIKYPAKKGAYRLFLTVRDDSKTAAVANIPFLVK